MKNRVLLAILLFFVAPLVAEFLLGDLPINLLGTLIILAPMYGGGALLVREFARRSGRGWPTILVVAFAYAVFEEAFTTETLFNPNYLGLNLHLLQPGYIPTLGIGGWWTVFVLTLHTVWSISVSIGLVEALAPQEARTPWLGWIGTAVVAVLFGLASAVSTVYAVKSDRSHFVASVPQFVWAAIVVALAIVVAFLLPRRGAKGADAGWVPAPWLVGALALAAGSIFLVVPKTWGWLAVVVYLALDLTMIGLVASWSQRTLWGEGHRLALAGGAALAYAWHAFFQNPAVGHAGIVDRVGNVVFAVGLLILLVIAGRRVAAHAAVPASVS